MSLLNKLLYFLIRRIAFKYQDLRIYLFKILSNNNIIGKPKINTPCLFIGKGKIHFKNNVTLGIFPSPNYYNGSIYIESRSVNSEVCIADNVFINNNFRLICDNSKIAIEEDCLIGINVEIIDSDFHELDPKNRNRGRHTSKSVLIKKNVFIGNNVTILKGVTIGENSVISNGSVVTKDVPSNTVFGGNPATFIKNI